MKIRYALYSALFLIIPMLSQAALTGLSGEVYAVDGVAGTTTYRVYAEFDDPADQLIAMYGADFAPLVYTVTTSTFQEATVGGPTSLAQNPGLYAFFPDLEFDSYFTIGADVNSPNTLSEIGFDWTDFEAGGDYTINDIIGATMFVLPGDPQAVPVGGKVLIAQITTDGVFDLTVNLQYRDPAQNPIEVPGLNITLPVLMPGCTDPAALNYDPLANEDDGSCMYPAPSFTELTYELVASDAISGMDTYRVYANFTNPLDQLTAVYGQDATPLSIATTGSFYQDGNGGPSSLDINAALYGAFPDLQYDSWVTIGEEDNSANALQTLNIDFSGFEGGGDLTINDPTGGVWYVFPDAQPSAFPDAMGRVLIAQLTTDGFVDMTVNLQYRAQDGTNPQVDGLNLMFPDMISGCTDPAADNYNAMANVDDGSCIFSGCTYPDATNYDPAATVDDGSCMFNSVCPGCTDPTAFNYNANATVDDGSCIAVANGCTDCSAFNYDPAANTDDGSCIATVFGCTDATAFNFDPAANVDNGGCVAVALGCTDVMFDNYNPYANTDDGSCQNLCLGDLNQDLVINAADLLTFLSVFGTVCP